MYRRQIEVIGKNSQLLLSKKKALIVGCGGLGNIIATTIGCIGLKKIYLSDFDEIELHNIHRQFQFKKNDIGKKKADVLAERIARCDTEVEVLQGYFDENSDLNVDIVFDATDNFEVRKKIDEFAKKHNIPWIYASVEEWHGQVGVFKTASFDVFAAKSHNVKGQLPPMVNLIGSISASLGMKCLVGKCEEVLYYVDFTDGLEVKKFGF